MKSTEGQHWGFWSTLAWSALIGILFVVVQSAVAYAWLWFATRAEGEGSGPRLYEQVAVDGDVLGLATIASAIICGALLLGVVTLKRGSNLRQYLALHAVSPVAAIRWIAGFIALLLALDWLLRLLDQAATPDVMYDLYSSTDNKPLLFVATVIAAPVFEELFFRGFLLPGLQDTFLRNWGSVILTSALWSLVHVQYDVYGVATIFAIGLVLGAARVRSGSTSLSIILHALNNAIAFASMVLLAQT